VVSLHQQLISPLVFSHYLPVYLVFYAKAHQAIAQPMAFHKQQVEK